MREEKRYDFVISYAGEDLKIAKEISDRLKEKALNFSVFLAEEEKSLLIGTDGESFFERLFSKAKEVIVQIGRASCRERV